jgi:DNA polymerase-3 subunit alpha
MCGFAQALKYQEKCKKEGKNFKVIFGEEFYFIDSLEDWKALKENAKKETKKKNTKKENVLENENLIIDPFKDSVDEMKDSSNDILLEENAKKEKEETTVVENENETKSIKKWLDPLRQRNHLVLLAKNNYGLKSLFKLCSTSYKEGFYYYPRIDFRLLEQYANGNIIASSACLGSRLQKCITDKITDIDNIEQITFDELIKYKFNEIQEDIHAVTEKFIDVLKGKENFFLELQFNKIIWQHLLNYHLIQAAKTHNYNLVVTSDSHYSNPDHWREREIYKAMTWMSRGKETFDVSTLPKSVDELKCELYPKNHSQIWDSYIKYCKNEYPFYKQHDDIIVDAIEKTHIIAHEMIDKDISVDKNVKLPPVEKLFEKEQLEKLTEDKTKTENEIVYQEIARLVKEGLKEKQLSHKKEYVERAINELKVIKHLGLQKYFLTYYQIMKIISDHMLTGSGRGSAVGSMVAYLLKITHIDPIKNGLLFERFLVRNKKGAADIDSDCADRALAVRLITQHFGEENVIPVTNYNQLQLKALMKDLSKLYGIPFEEVNIITKLVEKETLDADKQEEDFDRGVWFLTYESALKNSQTFRYFLQKYPELTKPLQVLFKQKKSVSRHAGGLYIGVDATHEMPLIMGGKQEKKSFQTPFTEGINIRELEELGFLKFDILGLGTLRIMEEAIRRILQKQGIKHPSYAQINQWHYKNIHPDNNNFDDLKVYKHVFENKNYCSTFQFDKAEAQRLMTKISPNCFNDIVASISINRPGPMSLNVDEDYIKNKNNPELSNSLHPLLREVLSDSRNCMLFQEQLQLIYHKMAGVPLDDTDQIRKSFTKKEIAGKEKRAEDREKLKIEFVKRCKEINQIPENVSNQIFDYMSKLVAYTFNKSHATAYAALTYQTAYMTTYYPDEWVAACLDAASLDIKTMGDSIKEAQNLGYKIGKIDINKSNNKFVVIDKILFPSITSLKYVGDTVLEEMEKYKPYTKLSDLLLNTDKTWRHTKLNKRALSTLIQVEAFDSMNLVGPEKLFKNYKQMHLVLIGKFDQLKRIASRKKNNDVETAIVEFAKEVENEQDWTVVEKTNFSYSLAGTVSTETIVPEKTRRELEEDGFYCLDDFSDAGGYWAIISSASNATTSTGKPFIRLKLFGLDNIEYGCSLWGHKGKAEDFKKFDVIVSYFQKNDKFGFSTQGKNLHIVKV